MGQKLTPLEAMIMLDDLDGWSHSEGDTLEAVKAGDPLTTWSDWERHGVTISLEYVDGGLRSLDSVTVHDSRGDQVIEAKNNRDAMRQTILTVHAMRTL